MLTEYLNWRWALYVNVPIAVVGFIGALAFVHDPVRARAPRARLDMPGVILVTAGLVSLVYGFTRAESEGWGERGVVGLFVAAGVLLVAFVVVESLTGRRCCRCGWSWTATAAVPTSSVGLSVIAMFGLFLFLTYYLQIVKRYSPVETRPGVPADDRRHDHGLDADRGAADEPRPGAAC